LPRPNRLYFNPQPESKLLPCLRATPFFCSRLLSGRCASFLSAGVRPSRAMVIPTHTTRHFAKLKRPVSTRSPGGSFRHRRYLRRGASGRGASRVAKSGPFDHPPTGCKSPFEPPCRLDRAMPVTHLGSSSRFRRSRQPFARHLSGALHRALFPDRGKQYGAIRLSGIMRKSLRLNSALRNSATRVARRRSHGVSGE
jgi:hypothetical protein